MIKMKKTLAVLLGASALLAASAVQAQANEQFVSLLSYRVGPYGNNGISVFGAWIDYMKLVNAKGGVNGVKLTWEECETEYNNARGVECYERLKSKSPTKGSMIHPVSTGISYSLLDKTLADKVPLVMIGYGRTDTIDGRYFPYAFPLVTTYQMQASAMLKFIATREGKKETSDLAGKKIAFVYHDSAFGKEPLEVLRAESALNKFEIVEIPVAHPGIEQTAQWQQVRQAKPDYVIFWGWGAMNSAGLQAAQKVGFPREKMIGVWWAGAEEDTVPAGPGAKGYIAANFGIVGKDIPVTQEILKTVYSAGQGDMKDQAKIGSVLYTRGVLHGIITVEAIRTAQAKFGNRVLTGEEIQWGLEHLKIDQKRLKELGAEGLMPDINVTCADHEGSGKVMFQQWDGTKWNKISDYLEGNRKLVRQLLDASAKKYAEEKKLQPRDCAKIDMAAAPAAQAKKK
jgi:branched-chain amino acid transport system substrate-binding protein